MALQKPYNLNISGLTIDAKESFDLTWSVTGDIQYIYKVEIYNNADNSLAYTSGAIISYSWRHTILPNSLVNGNEYKLIVYVYNEAGTVQISNPVIFRCSSRPVVIVPTMSVIASPTYLFSCVYTQGENVPFSSWVTYLYNSKKNIVKGSGLQTSRNLEYEFTSLHSDENYFIEFQVTSANGLTGTSGLIPFSVYFPTPIVNVELLGKNIENAGVELSWFIGQILGKTDGSQFINGDKIDTTDGTKVWFDSGFNIDGNFSIKLLIESLIGSRPLITLTGRNGNMILIYNSVQQRFVLKKTVENMTSVYISEIVNADKYAVVIEQIGSEINLIAKGY